MAKMTLFDDADHRPEQPKAEKAANQSRRLRARTLVWNENIKNIDCHCLDCVRHAGAFDQERGQHAVQKSDISPDDGTVTPQQREAV